MGILDDKGVQTKTTGVWGKSRWEPTTQRIHYWRMVGPYWESLCGLTTSTDYWQEPVEFTEEKMNLYNIAARDRLRCKTCEKCLAKEEATK